MSTSNPSPHTAPPLRPGTRVRVRVDRQRKGGVDFAGGWYAGTVEAVRRNDVGIPLYADAWAWCYVVRTEKGATFDHCNPECVVMA